MSNAGSTWENPWTWPPYRRQRRRSLTASILVSAAILAAIPAGWIVLVPTDPTLRPDLTTNWAWIVLGLCALLAIISQTIARNGRAAFDRAVYEITQATRDAAVAQGMSLDVTLSESFPPVLLSRQRRKVGIAGPRPLLVGMDGIEVILETGATRLPDAPRQPHVVLRFKDGDPAYIFIAPRGDAASVESARALAEDLRDYFHMPATWDAKPTRTIDMAAFIESMRP